MDLKKAKRVLQEVAREENVTEREVVESIEEAIAEAVELARKTGNEKVLKKWACIPCAGELPTAYEMVAYMGAVLSFLS